jgi:hypothetical protein
MKNKVRPEIAIVLCLLVPATFGQTVAPGSSPGPRYLVFDEKDVSATNRELAYVAAKGYHIVAAAPKVREHYATGLTAILERNEEGSPPREYFLFDDRGNGLAQAVNDAAAKGYRVVARGAFDRKKHDWGAHARAAFWESFFNALLHRSNFYDRVDATQFESYLGYVLMESGSNRSEVPCRYFVLDPRKTAFFENSVQSGNRIVSAEGAPWVMESCPKEPDSSTVTSDPVTLRSLLLTGKAKKDQRALDLAVADGFRVAYAAGPHLTLEKAPSAAGPAEYALIAKGSVASLEKRLNSAPGFRAVSRSLVMRHGDWGNLRLSVVLERTPGLSTAYQYRVLRKDPGADLQEQLNRVAGQGYQAKDLASDSAGIIVLMERSSSSRPH